MSNQEEFTLTREDIERISGVVAEVVVKQVEGSDRIVLESGGGTIAEIDLDALASETAGILDPLGQLRDWLANTFNSVAAWITQSVSGFIDEYVIPAISDVYSYITNNVVPAITGVIDSVISGVTSLINDYVLPAIDSAASSIITGVSEIGSSITSFINTYVVPSLNALYGFVTESLLPAITGVASSIYGFITDIVLPAIGEAAVSVSSFITDTIIPAISSIASSISSFITEQVIPTILSIPDMVGGLIGNVIDTIISGFNQMVSMISAGFAELGKVTMGFINAVLKFPEWFPQWFYDTIAKPISDALSSLSKWIWEMMPDWLRNGLTWFGDILSKTGETLINVFTNLGSMIVEFIKNPFAALQNVFKWIVEGLSWLGEQLWGAVTSMGSFVSKQLAGLWEMAKSGYELIIDKTTDFFSWIWGSVIGKFWDMVIGAIAEGAEIAGKIMNALVGKFLGEAKETVMEIGKKFVSVEKAIIEPFGKPLGETLEKPFASFVERVYKGKKVAGEFIEILEMLGSSMLAILSAGVFGRGMNVILHAIANHIPDNWSYSVVIGWRTVAKGKGKASPQGVGGEGEAGAEASKRVPIKATFSVKWLFRQIAGTLKEAPDTFTRSLMYGFGIWMSRPLYRLANAAFRNMTVVEMPSTPLLVEILQRHMGYGVDSDEFKGMLESVKGYLRLYGYNDAFIDWMTGDESITVKDRFNVERKIPLSLMYDLPSSSDVARMMVRDIILELDYFKRLFSARGMPEQVAPMYYLLHFRYPPPERLWAFTMRGVAGMLWATLTEGEAEEAKKELAKLGVTDEEYVPKPPVELNWKHKKLFEAFKKYMKWHDFARISYIKGFTSDNMIYIDTMADIPTKIDQRWMVRWGLYDFLADKGVTSSSPVSEFATKILEDEPASNIRLNLSNFTRTLLATGLHPDWTPITAIAETMNAMTDERTLLRTGVMNLYKEGFYNVKAMESLMSGVLKISFKVSYFDSRKMEWIRNKWVNVPLMFLPPERKLLQLRALMDRVLDILRDIMRDVSVAYRENIIWDTNEVKAKIDNAVKPLSEMFADEYEKITGVSLPDELRIAISENYLNAYFEAMKIERAIYNIRRIRGWTMYWMGWIIYRLATGVISMEDFESLIEDLKQYNKFSTEEVSYVKTLAGYLVKANKKEYIPTPSQLATISEYIPEARNLFDEVVEARGIPEEWRDIWAKYVDYKPIMDEVKKMLSRVESLYEYFAITEEDYKKVLESVRQFGWTDKEIEFMLEVSRYQRFLRAYRELVGDVDRMVSVSNYSPLAEDFALGQLYKMIDAMPIDGATKEVLKKMWEQYIRNRHIKSEVITYVRDLVNLYIDGLLSRIDLEKELTWLEEYGLTKYEREFWLRIAEVRKARKLRIPVVFVEGGGA